MREDFIDACMSLADLYEGRFVQATREACPELEEDPWDSLRFFLLGYAFEHRIRSPDCTRAAAEALDEAKGRAVTKGAAKTIWKSFTGKMKGRGLNPASNPLCPRGFCYVRRFKGEPREREVRGLSAIELVARKLQGKPIVAWAKESMQSGRLVGAHALLTAVNGVSEATASCFLRDVATVYGVNPPAERGLLQPVDSWTMLVARACSGDPKLRARDCASFILSSARDPERASQGIWYYCTQVAGASRLQVELSLEDSGHMNFLMDQHLRGLVVGGEAAIGFAMRRQPGLLVGAAERESKRTRAKRP